MSNYPKEEINRFAEVFKALSNPNRLQIFLSLVSCCPPGTKCNYSDAAMRRCVGELGQGLDIDQSTVSHHLKELRRAGLSAEVYPEPRKLTVQLKYAERRGIHQVGRLLLIVQGLLGLLALLARRRHRDPAGAFGHAEAARQLDAVALEEAEDRGVEMARGRSW